MASSSFHVNRLKQLKNTKSEHPGFCYFSCLLLAKVTSTVTTVLCLALGSQIVVYEDPVLGYRFASVYLAMLTSEWRGDGMKTTRMEKGDASSRAPSHSSLACHTVKLTFVL